MVGKNAGLVRAVVVPNAPGKARCHASVRHLLVRVTHTSPSDINARGFPVTIRVVRILPSIGWARITAGNDYGPIQVPYTQNGWIDEGEFLVLLF